ncbi:hypothetical protein B0H14DRAFT_3475038 [Mycena olivaceomarginata]|nr:hypothetical protein B0H14DRAFT_3475038 [Mycena olivaceomarginata]
MLFVKLTTILSSMAIFVHVASALAITVPIYDDEVATILEDATGPVTAVLGEVKLLATDVFRPIATVTFAL